MSRRNKPHVMRWPLILMLAATAFLLWPAAYGGSTSLVVVSGTSMEPTYHTGDVLLMRKTTPKVGDVIAFTVPDGDGEIVHRVVEQRSDGTFMTRGDNRSTPDLPMPSNADVVGVSLLLIPQGWWIVQLLTSPLVLGVAMGAWVVARELRRHFAEVSAWSHAHLLHHAAVVNEGSHG